MWIRMCLCVIDEEVTAALMRIMTTVRGLMWIRITLVSQGTRDISHFDVSPKKGNEAVN